MKFKVTYILMKRGVLKRPSERLIRAADALPDLPGADALVD